MSQYLYLRCPVCERVAPLLQRKADDGCVEMMRFELQGFDLRRLTSDYVDVPYACRRCAMKPGWHYETPESAQ